MTKTANLDQYDRTQVILNGIVGSRDSGALDAIEEGFYGIGSALEDGIYAAGRGGIEFAEGIESAGVDVAEALGSAVEAGAEAIGDIAKSTASTAVVFGGLTTVFGAAFFGLVGYGLYKWL